MHVQYIQRAANTCLRRLITSLNHFLRTDCHVETHKPNASYTTDHFLQLGTSWWLSDTFLSKSSTRKQIDGLMHVLCHISIFAPIMTKMPRGNRHNNDSLRNATLFLCNHSLPNHRSHRQFRVQGICKTPVMQVCPNHEAWIVHWWSRR